VRVITSTLAVMLHMVGRIGRLYYQLIEVKMVEGKIVQKCVVYPGKIPKQKAEVKSGDIPQYAERLLNIEV
jgi:hypothetical protein